MKYQVAATVQLNVTVEVEAESPKQALALADDLLAKGVESRGVRIGRATTDLRVLDLEGNLLLDHDEDGVRGKTAR
jgi:hypothetical protein